MSKEGKQSRPLQILSEIVARRDPAKLAWVAAAEDGSLPEQGREQLREIVADELCEFGLAGDDSPTPHGLMLESLIDWLGHR